MAVEPETFEAPPSAVTAKAASADRGRCGNWGVTLDLAGEVRLPDGRVLLVRRRVRVKAQQWGVKQPSHAARENNGS